MIENEVFTPEWVVRGRRHENSMSELIKNPKIVTTKTQHTGSTWERHFRDFCPFQLRSFIRSGWNYVDYAAY